MNKEAFGLLSAIAAAHQHLGNHASRLRQRPGVREVTHQFHMPALDGAVRFEEFVDAELVSEEAFSWSLETTITENEIFVEADVRRIHSEGQDVVCQVAESAYRTDNAAALALPEIAQRLCLASPI